MKARLELKVFGGDSGVHDLHRYVELDAIPVPGLYVEPANGYSATVVTSVFLRLNGHEASVVVRLQAWRIEEPELLADLVVAGWVEE